MTYSANNARSTGFTAWLALFAVLLLQVSTAAHEAQHAPADAAEVCDVCVQLDTTGPVAVDGAARNPVPHLVGNLDDWSDAVAVAPAYQLPTSRAPPALI